MGKDTPKPPNAAALASAQGAANIEAIQESAKLNALDQYAPWGSTTYDKNDEGLPTAQRIALGPAEQEFYNRSGDIKNALASRAGLMSGFLPTERFSLDDVPNGSALANTLYQRRLAMIKPELDEAQKQTNIMLGERGIPINSEIWNTEQDRVGRARDATYTALAQDAELARGAEEDRLLSRALTERALPFNEVSAFLQGTPAMQTPTFANTPSYQIQAPNIAGLTQQQYENNLARSQQRNSWLTDGLFGLAGLAF